MKRSASYCDIRRLSICILFLLSSVAAAAQNEQVLHVFGQSSKDGALPIGALIPDTAGNLYGTTAFGGPNFDGTVFEMTAPTSHRSWAEVVIYTFGLEGVNLQEPSPNLIFDKSGNLYGTTGGGGDPSCRCGTVFELSPPIAPGGNWVETTLYSFVGGNDGDEPGSLVMDQAGNLYGTTVYGGGIGSCGGTTIPGCGTVFELSPPSAPGGVWTEAVLYSFSGGNDGGDPLSMLVLDKTGNLYGTTNLGGKGTFCESGFPNCGTVFELSPTGGGSWMETVLHNFGSFEGDGYSAYAGALLLTDSGELAGASPGGGTYGGGAVFGLRPPSIPGREWAYAVLYSFGGSPTDGLIPVGGIISNHNVIYGTTQNGGSQVSGTIFRLNRLAGGKWEETGLFSFDSTDGQSPRGALLIHNGALFGTTAQGGSKADAGTVFKITN